MRRFWRRRKAAAPSVATGLELHAWPSITTTTPERYGDSCASAVTIISWAQPMTPPTYSNGQYAIYDDPQRGTYWGWWSARTGFQTFKAPERKRMSTRPYESVSVEAIAADDASAAVVRYQGLEAYGSAKRNKHERKNADTGIDLAVGRAFVNLGKQMQKRGLKRIGDK
jgi:hypothetical protein